MEKERNINSAKVDQLTKFTTSHTNAKLTTNQGVGVENTDDSLKAGIRGATLLEDFILREKITHFDHERIPERVVHARGTGAHGYFKVYENLSDLTMAHVFSDPNLITPVFARFSTVAGFRGSPDTVRDVRGFAVKFYTQEGNYDIVGNNMPVFFIQDAIKFPDLIHAVKPEPHNEMPQAASAHDTFWDFVSNTPETAHNVMWLMSDRAIPRSYRMMEGFGIHAFRFINKQGKAKFVKFHWKPLLGVHSLVWDETQKIAGKDPDFNRRDLFEAIENGNYPEWELGIQVLDPKDEFKFDFDILDSTKLWPEEIVPVRKIGKMVLNRNVTNFFAETEQVAFCPANIVPGIDFSNDPLLQGRLFSYLDTQLSRLGGVNFHQIPINMPLNAINNNQRDGHHRMNIDSGVTAYFPNALNKGEPHPASDNEIAFKHYQEKIEGYKIRARSDSFRDFYSQPAMFYNSLSAAEQAHVIDAFTFELGKVRNKNVRQAVVDMIGNIDSDLATIVANSIGSTPPKQKIAFDKNIVSAALSMANTSFSAKTLKVAILVENGFNKAESDEIIKALTAAGAAYDIVSGGLGKVTSMNGEQLDCAQTYLTTASVLYDAIYIPGGKSSVETIMGNGTAIHYINETFKHFKPIAAGGEAVEALKASQINGIVKLCIKDNVSSDKGVVTCGLNANLQEFAASFVKALAKMRFWERTQVTPIIQA